MSTPGKQRKLIREAKPVKAFGGEPTPAQKKMLPTKRRKVQRHAG